MTGDGVGLTVELSNDGGLPRVLHWGADPGEVLPAPFGLSALSLPPVQHNGWQGRPAIGGDRLAHIRLRLCGTAELTAGTPTFDAADDGVAVRGEMVVTPEGVLKVRYTATNTARAPWTVAALRAMLPVPEEAAEVLDFTGRWAFERVPQRAPPNFGAHVRENRRGRTGHDSATILAVGTPGFTHRTGKVWAVHIGWSGNHGHACERFLTRRPHWVAASCCSRPTHPRTPRPVVLNTWEAGKGISAS